jgi:hypothetical protein
MANPSLNHRNRNRLTSAVSRFASLALALAGLLSMSSHANSQDSFDINEAERMMSADIVDLRSQLVFGLRTNLPGQVQFIDSVIAKVESKEISRSMVNVIFVWARKRNPKIPYPYFEVALRLLAEKRGVTFPATNSIIVAQ